MKTLFLAFSAFACLMLVRGQEMDKELASLTEKLAGAIKANATKKVTVLDFTDLQGGETELGKYIAEMLSLNFVLVKRDFDVLDRANLAKILAEHKLTAKGLVDPENAKKLGQFAGVDALVTGTIIPKGQNISLIAKIIAIDTTKLAGGGHADFKIDETVKELMSRTVSAPKEAETTGASGSAPPPVRKSFGDLAIALHRLAGLQNGAMSVDLIFQNTSKTKSIGVAMYAEVAAVPPSQLRTSLTGFDGTECKPLYDDEVTGLNPMRANPSRLIVIKPGEEIRPNIKFMPLRPFAENLTGMKLQSELVINTDYRESLYANYRPENNTLPPGCVIQNLVLEIPLGKRK